MKKFTVLVLVLGMTANVVFGQEKPDTSRIEQGFKKYRFGGYGEILFRHMDFGADRYNYGDGAQPDSVRQSDCHALFFRSIINSGTT